MIMLELKLVVKVTVTQKRYATPHTPKMHPHAKFCIPTSNDIGDMFRTPEHSDTFCRFRAFLLGKVLPIFERLNCFYVGHINVPLVFELCLGKSFGRVMDLHYCSQFIFKINACTVK